MKIGLYFGSFNPLHNGHLMISNYVVDYLELDKLLFVVSPNNPFKNSKTLCDVGLRLEMVKSAISSNKKLEVSDIEVDMPKPSYTIDTLHRIFETYGDNNDYYLVMGLDNWCSIKQWKKYDEVLKLVNIVVLPRLTSSINSLSDCLHIYEKTKEEIEINLDVKSQFLKNAPVSAISSTFIRNNIENKTLIKEYVPDEVFKIINDLKLYNMNARIEISVDEYNGLKNKIKDLESNIAESDKKIEYLESKYHEVNDALDYVINGTTWAERTLQWKQIIKAINFKRYDDNSK